MLAMAAFQFGHPVLFGVLVESDNSLFHAVGQSSGGRVQMRRQVQWTNSADINILHSSMQQAACRALAPSGARLGALSTEDARAARKMLRIYPGDTSSQRSSTRQSAHR